MCQGEGAGQVLTTPQSGGYVCDGQETITHHTHVHIALTRTYTTNTHTTNMHSTNTHSTNTHTHPQELYLPI